MFCIYWCIFSHGGDDNIFDERYSPGCSILAKDRAYLYEKTYGNSYAKRRLHDGKGDIS